MGALVRSSLLWVFTTILWIVVTHADPLSVDALKKAQKIGILVSDFDPVTNSDIDIAKTACKQGGPDHVILLPTLRSFRKSLLPYAMRAQMLSSASADNPTVLTPTPSAQDELSTIYESQGPSGFEKAIRKLNPSIKIDYVKSEETLTNSSNNAFQARQLISQNPDFYLDPSFQPSQELTRLLHPQVIDLIRQNGYYLGRLVNNVRSLNGMWDRYLKETVMPIWMREIFRQYRIEKNSKFDRTEIAVNGTTYPVERHLASGLGADVFIITLDGHKVVAKVPIGTPRSIELARAEFTIRKWLETHTKIHVPKLLGFDLESGVSIAEFIAGPDVGVYLGLNGSRTLPEGIDVELSSLYQESKALLTTSNLRLDLRSDNLKVRDGQVYLIDLGALQAAGSFPQFNQLLETWVEQAKGSASYCSQLLMKREK